METTITRLRVTEIFYSLQGESRTVGMPTVFIRLTGCPLRCQYCDTSYAFSGGQWMDLQEILEQVGRYQTPYITVTGGEPLAQPDCHALLTLLCDTGYEVSLETSGALDISTVDKRVVKVMDIKTPDSAEEQKNRWENIDALEAKDQVKFVICSEADYEWAKAVLSGYKLNDRCEVLFSPSYQQLAPRTLAEWILRDQLTVRFQLQLHKILWGEEQGR